MGRIIPTEIKAPFEMTPRGTFLFEVTAAQEAWVGKVGEEVYGIVISHRVLEPADAAGIEHDETFFIGVGPNAKAVKDGKLQADPEANNDATWTARAGMLEKYMHKHGIEIKGADIEVVLQTVVGKQIIGKIIHVPAIKDGKPMLRDDGSQLMNARAERWFAPGEAQPELAPELPAPVATAPGNGARPAGPAPGPRPVAPAPVGAAPAAAAAPPARPPMRRIGR